MCLTQLNVHVLPTSYSSTGVLGGVTFYLVAQGTRIFHLEALPFPGSSLPAHPGDVSPMGCAWKCVCHCCPALSHVVALAARGARKCGQEQAHEEKRTGFSVDTAGSASSARTV